MAHHLAMHGSRFEYSHSHAFVPVHGIEAALAKQEMIMTFKSVGGSQVPYHSSMDYLYRPKELESLCAYQYYSQTKLVPKRQAETENQEYFSLRKAHPLQSQKVVVYRDQCSVATFPWRWLGSTRTFSSSIADQDGNNGITTLERNEKEIYCRRFMILFLPFRKAKDLMYKTSYLLKLQKVLNPRSEVSIGDDMIQIAENVQTIHNSLASTVPENILTAETEEAPLDEDAMPVEEDQPDDYDAMLLNIGSYLASTEDSELLSESPTSFNPLDTCSFVNVVTPPHETPPPTLEAVFEFHAESEVLSGASDVPMAQTRFIAKLSSLNSLLSFRFLKVNEAIEPESDTENMAEPCSHQVWNADATGSWESIVAWGRISGLDTEQQMAFEILVATYVLTFHDDADQDIQTTPMLQEQVAVLEKFARQHFSIQQPLRLFITGPAGVGKCKFLAGGKSCFRFHYILTTFQH